MSDADEGLQALVAQVAAAYFTNAHVPPNDIPSVIGQIAQSLGEVGRAHTSNATTEAQPKATKAQIKRSMAADGLTSFEDGKTYKTLRRHLSTRGMTPEQYREKWGLPSDYPMVAPSYSASRSAIAKELGLGQRAQQARRSTKGRAHARTTTNDAT